MHQTLNQFEKPNTRDRSMEEEVHRARDQLQQCLRIRDKEEVQQLRDNHRITYQKKQ